MKKTKTIIHRILTASLAIAGVSLNPQTHAGVAASSTIGDRVWMDANANGRQDSGELSVPGVTVILWDQFENMFPTITDANGRFRFENLIDGEYWLQFILPSNTVFTAPNATTEGRDSDVTEPLDGFTDSFTVAPGQTLLNQDAGIISTVPGNPGELGDRVWLDLNANGAQDAGEQSVPGVHVSLWNDLNNDGTPDNLVDSQLTAANGRYRFLNVPAGIAHMIEFTLPIDHVFTLQDATTEGVDSDVNPATSFTGPITLASGQILVNQDAGLIPTGPLAPGEVGDRVWLDSNQNGHQDPGEQSVAGVPVELWSDTDNNGLPDTPLDIQQTGANGRYRFLNVPAGVAHMVFFGLIPDTTYTQPNASTEGLDSDALTAGVPLAGFTEPFVLNPGQILLNQDAGLLPTAPLPPGELGDLVWQDLNENGRRDAGEPGIPGVPVRLWVDFNGDNTPDDIVGMATTDGIGRYRFLNVPAGVQHFIEFVPPPGQVFTVPNAAPEGVDSDAEPFNGMTAPITLGLGQILLNQDAGFIQLQF